MAAILLTGAVASGVRCCADFLPCFGILALTLSDETDLYYPHRDFPKLTTPQWIGDDGVDAAIILAIDDMRDPAKEKKRGRSSFR